MLYISSCYKASTKCWIRVLHSEKRVLHITEQFIVGAAVTSTIFRNATLVRSIWLFTQLMQCDSCLTSMVPTKDLMQTSSNSKKRKTKKTVVGQSRGCTIKYRASADMKPSLLRVHLELKIKIVGHMMGWPVEDDGCCRTRWKTLPRWGTGEHCCKVSNERGHSSRFSFFIWNVRET